MALNLADNWRHSVMVDDKKRLSECGLKDGDIVVIERRSDKRKTAAKVKGDVRRGFSLLHHEKQCVCTPAGQCPICAGPSPPAPNLTVRPLTSASGIPPVRPNIKFELLANLTVRPLTSASDIPPERPNIKFELLSVRRFSNVYYV